MSHLTNEETVNNHVSNRTHTHTHRQYVRDLAASRLVFLSEFTFSETLNPSRNSWLQFSLWAPTENIFPSKLEMFLLVKTWCDKQQSKFLSLNNWWRRLRMVQSYCLSELLHLQTSLNYIRVVLLLLLFCIITSHRATQTPCKYIKLTC